MTLKERYRYSKKLTSKYAADVSVTNCGGIILWIGDIDTMEDRVMCQEEIMLDSICGFSRLLNKKIYYSGKGSYVMHNRRRFYLREFYKRW